MSSLTKKGFLLTNPQTAGRFIFLRRRQPKQSILRRLRRLKMAYAALLFCVVTAIALPAQTFTTLASFDSTDGSEPYAGLTQGTDGNFYGTTLDGGANKDGTIFKIVSAGTLTTLHSFDKTDGASPNAGLVQGTDGNFYGTTESGGASSNCSSGCGTVFEITPAGTLTTLYSFCMNAGCADGWMPYGGLVQGSDGNFYGTVNSGGASSACIGGCGTIFKITPAGTLTTLHSFVKTDGAYPESWLVQGTDGNFYGTAQEGGPNNAGTVFKMTPAGTLTVLYSFCSSTNCADGAYPVAGLVQGTDGNFYGTTVAAGNFACDYGNGTPDGCGTVFQITPAGTLTTLHTFAGWPNDGAWPRGGLIQATDGNFYGTSVNGGANECPSGPYGGPQGCGTIFEITPAGTLTTLYSFGSTYNPLAGLMQATDGNFYGTTEYGGNYTACDYTGACGTVFKLSVGLGPFVETEPTSGAVETSVVILGTNLTGASSVSFNGTEATFTVVSSSKITTAVPAGATTGPVQVVTPGGTLTSNKPFVVMEATGFTLSANPSSLTIAQGGQAVSIITINPVNGFSGTVTLSLPGLPNGVTVTGLGPTKTDSYLIFTVNSLATPGTSTLTVIGTSGSLTQTVPLSLTVTASPATTVTVTPASLSFGDEAVDDTSAAKWVTLENTGTATLILDSIAVTPGSSFALASRLCVFTLAAGKTCKVSVTFTPTQLGTATGTLSFTDNTANSPQTVALSGTGVEPATLAPTSLMFSKTKVGATSAAKKVTLKNNQPTSLTGISYSTTGPFAVAASTCTTTLNSKKRCTISVTFSPKKTGTASGILAVSDSASNSPQTASLTGTGD